MDITTKNEARNIAMRYMKAYLWAAHLIEGHSSMSEVVTERRTYSVEEAARLLGISRPAAYDAAKNGGLPVIRIGGRVLVVKAALDKLLAAA